MADKKQVQWNRSDEGFVDSKCGRFSIEPIFGGRINSIGHTLRVAGRTRGLLGVDASQRDCKEIAEDAAKWLSASFSGRLKLHGEKIEHCREACVRAKSSPNVAWRIIIAQRNLDDAYLALKEDVEASQSRLP